MSLPEVCLPALPAFCWASIVFAHGRKAFVRPKHRPACKDIIDTMLCDLGQAGLEVIS